MRRTSEKLKAVLKLREKQPDPHPNSSGSEKSPRLLREQDKQAPPQSLVGSLWKEAADSLDQKDQKKLDNLKSKREENAADSSPNSQGGSSAPYSHGEESRVDDVSCILSRAGKLKEEDKEATWGPVIDKIIDGVLKFKSLGDAAVMFDKSGYAALGWSVVSFGLQVAKNAKEAREFVLSSSEVVTGFMTRYAEYEKERGRHAGEEFDRRMRNVYKAILLYVIALNDYLQQRAPEHCGRAIYEIHDRSISERKKAIDDADKEVKDWLPIIMSRSNNDNFSKVLKELEAQSLLERSQQLRDCLKSLAFLEMDSRPNDTNVVAAKGTCGWLLGQNIFRRWAACDRGLLWIKGKPGSGKSTLLRYAVDNIMAIPNIGDEPFILSFYFHGRGNELQRTPLGLYRSLLHQLLSRVPDALTELVANFQTKRENVGEPGEKWQWHLCQLQGFFKSSLPKVLENRSVWLFIDALDESDKENAVKLVKEFKSLLQDLRHTGLQFRICFTCRHYPILDQDCEFEICLEQENEQDISTYVEAQLSTSRMLTASTIPALITEHAKGIFMWARLVVDKALDLDNEGAGLKKIENKVKSIPPELDELYRELVHGMDEKLASLKLIQWIGFAKRPLSLDELRWAMVVDSDCSQTTLQQCQGAEDYASDSPMMERRLKALSRGLAETVLSSNARVVQFIHQSVQDFFVAKGLSVLESSLKSVKTDALEADLVGNAHYQLSRTCLRYLAMEEIARSSGGRDEMMSKFPLLHYATTSWVSHVTQSETKVPQDDLLLYFAWPSEALVQLWVRVYSIIERYSDDCPPKGTSMVHIVSRYQFMGPLRVILQKADLVGTNIDAKDSRGRTPLSWAAANGREAVVKVLLKSGKVDADLKDARYGQTPLSYAAERGHAAVVKLLLATEGVDANSKSNLGRTPLLYAAERGHAAVVKLLLATEGVNADSMSDSGRTPLSYAAENGHMAVVQLLLDNKVVADSKDKYFGQTPLLYAAERGREGVVKLLLKSGKVDADLKDARYGQTPLSYAAERGHAAVVKLLLATEGVDANSKSNLRQTPLLYAAERGYKGVVKLLLNSGKVDAASMSDLSQMTLSHPAENGYEAVIELLPATQGANADWKNDSSQTELSYAANREQVFKLNDDIRKQPEALSAADMTWHGQIRCKPGQSDASGYFHDRDQLANTIYCGDWKAMIRLLIHSRKAYDQDWVNCWRIVPSASTVGISAGFTPLHQAAWWGNEAAVRDLLQMGAWRLARTLRNKKDSRPLDIARDRGWENLYQLLNPVPKRRVNHEILQTLQDGLHRLIRQTFGDDPQAHLESFVLPKLEILTEFENSKIWFPLNPELLDTREGLGVHITLEGDNLVVITQWGRKERKTYRISSRDIRKT